MQGEKNSCVPKGLSLLLPFSPLLPEVRDPPFLFFIVAFAWQSLRHTPARKRTNLQVVRNNDHSVGPIVAHMGTTFLYAALFIFSLIAFGFQA
jgi:hypothetical protein